jgi:hypothetical protein
LYLPVPASVLPAGIHIINDEIICFCTISANRLKTRPPEPLKLFRETGVGIIILEDVSELNFFRFLIFGFKAKRIRFGNAPPMVPMVRMAQQTGL